MHSRQLLIGARNKTVTRAEEPKNSCMHLHRCMSPAKPNTSPLRAGWQRDVFGGGEIKAAGLLSEVLAPQQIYLRRFVMVAAEVPCFDKRGAGMIICGACISLPYISTSWSINACLHGKKTRARCRSEIDAVFFFNTPPKTNKPKLIIIRSQRQKCTSRRSLVAQSRFSVTPICKVAFFLKYLFILAPSVDCYYNYLSR